MEAEEAAPVQGKLALRAGRILLVEDHRLVRHVIVRALRGAGFGVLEAENGDAARKVCEDVAFDAAVLDISLPGEMDGIALGRWIRRQHRLVPLVFVTGLTEWEMPTPQRGDPHVYFLRKPFGAKAIVEFVGAALNKARRDGAAEATP
jgi:two-component system cell cycle sensor histidine kinase/response regulator CckA